MPVAPTYPGVYIEEIPSGVHTVTGVSTSVTAFIGYTARGPVNEPVHIFSFADFERAFGGITADSMLSYSVKQFFQNGGNEAYVVRVAQGAVVAQTTMRYATTGVGQAALDISAVSAGTWGNNLQVDVDYNTLNPASLFNMTVTEFVDRNGKLVPGRVEVFRNLSMNSKDPNFVIDTVNAGSQLVNVALSAGLNIAGTGTSTSGPLTDPDAAKVDATHNRLGVILDGRGPFEITLDVPPSAVTLDAVATDIRDKINLASGGKPVTFTSSTAAPTARPASSSSGSQTAAPRSRPRPGSGLYRPAPRVPRRRSLPCQLPARSRLTSAEVLGRRSSRTRHFRSGIRPRESTLRRRPMIWFSSSWRR